MTLNNSTNIKKTNNHIVTELIEHKERPRHMTLEIQVWTGTEMWRCSPD